MRQQPVSDISMIPYIKTTQEPRNFTKKGPVKTKIVCFSPHVRGENWIGFQSLVEFRIPWAAFLIPKPRIPDSKSKLTRLNGATALIWELEATVGRRDIILNGCKRDKSNSQKRRENVERVLHAWKVTRLLVLIVSFHIETLYLFRAIFGLPWKMVYEIVRYLFCQ